MTSILDKWLEDQSLTRYQLARASGISATTWQHVKERPLDRWTVKQIRAIAKCTGIAPATVLRELETLDKHVDIQ